MRKLLFLLIVALVAIAVYYHFNPHIAQHLPQMLQENLPRSDTTTAYKWRDSHGQWQLTDTPPENGITYETVTVKHDTNVLPSQAVSTNKSD